MSFKIGQFFGVPLYLNVFTILFGIFLLLVSGPIQLGMYVGCLFFVVLHEYGHSLAALSRKLVVEDITIYPFGGAANIYSENGYNATTELIVTICGPLVNAVIFLLLLPATIISYYRNDGIMFLACFIPLSINAVLFLFNLIPIYPMDGGRILRSLLSFKLSYEKATFYTIKFGHILAMLLIGLSLYYHLYMGAVVLVLMVILSQREINQSKMSSSVIKLIKTLSIRLDKPALTELTLPEVINELEKVDEPAKKDLNLEEIISIFKEIRSLDERV